MSSISFTGLSTGIDSNALIDQLVAAEKASANALAARQSDLNAQKGIVGNLSSLLSSLGTAARGLSTSSALAPRAATSSDTRISVTSSASAAAGTHTVRVDQLARAQVTSSSGFASSGAGAAGAGGLDITVAGTTKSVSWTATDSLASIASKINGAGAGVSASVLYDGANYQLVVTASGTGTANAATFAETGTPLGLTLPANARVPAADALVNIDGIDVVRSSNVIDDALAGVTITLASKHGASDAPSTVEVGLDDDALYKQVDAFVSAYNAVNTALQGQLSYTGTKKGGNTLFGDATLRQLQLTLGSVTTSEYGGTTVGTGATLGAIGVKRDKAGSLTLDRTKLADALSADPDALDKLFVSGGLAATLKSTVEQYTLGFTSADGELQPGILSSKTSSLDQRYKVLQSQIDRINRRADAIRAQLKEQFTAMETAVSKLQSQSAYVSRIL